MCAERKQQCSPRVCNWKCGRSHFPQGNRTWLCIIGGCSSSAEVAAQANVDVSVNL